MLVTLTSSSSGEIIMFADVAHHLFEIVGKQCTARGVFTREQLPDAIERLRQAAATEKDLPRRDDSLAGKDGDDEDGDPPGTQQRVGLAQRAYPLIELLDLTHKEDGFLMWDAEHDF